MIPAEFDYVVPGALSEVLGILNERGEDAKLLAGGHSLIPLMKLRLARPALLVDLRRLQELRGIERTATGLRIGALTTHAEVASSAAVLEAAPALAQAAAQIGDRQVRARGTIGGSLAHSDPAADLPAVALALNAELVVRSSSGERIIPAGSFFRGLLETDLKPNELLVEVRIAAAPRSAYVKMPNPASHYAIVGVAAALTGDGTVQSAAIGVTGAAATAYRATDAENALRGRQLTAEAIAAAAAQSVGGQEMLGDIHASQQYRAELVKVMTRRVLEKLAG